ncbi:MAG: hypothetical protein N2258_08865, partial [Brevinematales bacterium]|nr:hypothetical protein [Brevinematales bacterium]
MKKYSNFTIFCLLLTLFFSSCSTLPTQDNSEASSSSEMSGNVIDCLITSGTTFVITADNKLWVSGNNNHGQLGLSDIYRQTNNFILLFDNVAKVFSRGMNGTYILKKDGTLWATGENECGELGIGHYISQSCYIKIAENVSNAFFGNHCTFIIKNDGGLWGTGFNDCGSLGISED